MMKDNKSTPKVKGTVLYTVVSVLMVLIVFLMGTLALAATANRRSYTNYQKEQTEYTARLLLDSVVKTIEDDTTTTGIRQQMVNGLTSVGSSMTVTVTLEGVDHDVEITNVGEKTLYDETRTQWVTGDVYEVAAVNSKLLADTTFCAYIVGEHEVTRRSNGGGGAFVSMGDLGGSEIGTGGYITGGTYVGVGEAEHDYELGYNGETIMDAPFFAKGNVNAENEVFFHFTKPGDSFIVTGNYTANGAGGLIPVFDGFQWDPTLTDQSYEQLPYIFIGGTFKVDSQYKRLNNFNPFGEPDYAVNLYCGNIDVHSDVGLNLYGDLYTFESGTENKLGSNGADSKLYKWTAKTLQKEDSTTTELGSWYSMGAVRLSGNREIVIEGDLRVDNDIYIEDNCKLDVQGNIVCGGTLYNSSNNVTVTGIYASDISNTGKIECRRSVHSFAANIGNVVCATPYVPHTPSAADIVGAKRVWYDDFVIRTDAAAQNCEYSYNEYVDLLGAITTIPKTGMIYTGGYDPASGQTFEEFFEATVPEFHEIMEKSRNSGEVNATVENLYSIAGVYGDIYPPDFTRQKLLDPANGIVKQPEAADYENVYPTKISELGPNVYDSAAGALKIPTYREADLAGMKKNIPGGNTQDEWFEITTSCELTGVFNDNIYIKPNGNPITVILNNVRMSQDGGGGKTQIIIDDESQVTLFIRGTTKLDSGFIVTADWMDAIYGDTHTLAPRPGRPGNPGHGRGGGWFAGTRATSTLPMADAVTTVRQNAAVTDWFYPNVIIYGEENSVLDMSTNNSLVTAHIRAPEMKFLQKMGMQLEDKIEYIGSGTMIYGPGGSYSADANSLGVVGQLIAGQIVMDNNQKWGMLYVTDGGAGASCSCACARCNVTSPSTCACNCGTPGCICTGATPSGSIPARFTTLYYNYY
jgi:hypothetical protein